MKGFNKGNGLKTLKVALGQTVEVRVLTKPDDIISDYFHIDNFPTVSGMNSWKSVKCMNKFKGDDTCPLCNTYNDKGDLRKPSFKALLSVYVDGEEMLYSAPKSFFDALKSCYEIHKNINNRSFYVTAVKEDGFTKYKVTNGDKFDNYVEIQPELDIEEIYNKSLLTPQEAKLWMSGGVDVNNLNTDNGNDLPF